MPKVYLTEAARKEAANKKRNKLLAEHLRAYRAKERINQDELAKRVGSCRAIISRMENENPGSVTFETILNIVHATKMSAEDWLALGGYKT